MIRVMVTGLSLATEISGCVACNFDLGWLFNYPSVLVWTDKIVLSEKIWNTISSGEFEPQQPEVTKSVKLIFDIAKDAGIIEIIKPSHMLSKDIKKAIVIQSEQDRAQLAKLFPSRVSLGETKKVPGQMFIEGTEYCTPHVYSIYVSLAVARAIGAQCLFSEDVFKYCKYKFGLNRLPLQAKSENIQGFQSVFEAYFPNTTIFPEYVVVDKKRCLKCNREQTCKDGYLSEIENNILGILKWRDYDEVQQLKSVTEGIIKKRDKSGGIIDHEVILHDLKEEERKLRHRMKSIFPKIQRWSNITTLLSIPIALGGVASGSPLFMLGGASLVGMSRGTEKVIELLSSKYSWIGFLNKDILLNKEEK